MSNKIIDFELARQRSRTAKAITKASSNPKSSLISDENFTEADFGSIREDDIIGTTLEMCRMFVNNAGNGK